MKNTLKSLMLGAVALSLGTGAALAEYPDRPVTVIVPWGAGGGTDTVTRILAAGLEQELGQPINVVNRAGGNGVVGHMAIAKAKPDGYTIGACTPEIAYFKTLGLAPLTLDDFTIVSRMATIPAGITVKAGAYESAEALLEAIKSEPAGTFSSSGSGVGGTWHMAAGGLSKALGEPATKIKFVPSQGGAPALQDLVAGGLNLFTGSPIEAQTLADAGEVEVLAVMSDERLSSYPDVPTLKELGIDFELKNFFSLCGPAGLPDEVTAKLEEAGAVAHAGEAVQSALKERGITPVWDGSQKSTEAVEAFSESANAILVDLGVAK
ncbi:tripartite tricarboxylate transporter substrate binding protein [Acuticoccus sp. M5D2P5]|uniref:Bug family tripartite tricarboxylate transporter substrate binding protein n=1 Tax=Acuticoccus kalidii TaxID=2910977 RepID=UPI001F409837|nr:tripartite tricarboxylate transporter substrate binding protein [Acuticoccus kalidii]MCF3934604.1 tripartite tricarboxylate transporter substrate binding protein [Acuticoccus kalidii]